MAENLFHELFPNPESAREMAEGGCESPEHTHEMAERDREIKMILKQKKG